MTDSWLVEVEQLLEHILSVPLESRKDFEISEAVTVYLDQIESENDTVEAGEGPEGWHGEVSPVMINAEKFLRHFNNIPLEDRISDRITTAAREVLAQVRAQNGTL